MGEVCAAARGRASSRRPAGIGLAHRGAGARSCGVLARIRSAAVLGIEAYPVEVEVDLADGLPTFSTVGLAQGAVKESRERVHSALVNSGYELPLRRVTVNLAPPTSGRTGRLSTSRSPSACWRGVASCGRTASAA